MAKKKSDSGPQISAPKKRGALKLKSKSDAPQLIDATLAAQSVANTVATRARMENSSSAAAGEQPQRDSGLIQRLKQQGSQKSAPSAATNSLNSVLGVSKSNLPEQRKQPAHSQTMLNVGRINVPRRTGGG